MEPLQPQGDSEARIPPATKADRKSEAAQKEAAEKKAAEKKAAQQAVSAQQQLAILQAQIDSVAPDTDHAHIVFSRNYNNVVEVGLFDTQLGGQPAWAIRRHPNNLIKWTVPPDVAINAIEAKPGTDQLPIDPDPHNQLGKPGAPYKAKVKDLPVDPNNPTTETYEYLIDVTYQPKNGDAIRLVIDPEFIVNRP